MLRIESLYSPKRLVLLVGIYFSFCFCSLRLDAETGERGSIQTLAPCSLALMKAGERHPSGSWLNSSDYLHSLYYSEELRVLAGRLGVSRPESFGSEPKFGVMSSNPTFMEYALRVITALKARPQIKAQVEGWISFLHDAFQKRRAAARTREVRDAIDRWETDPAWDQPRKGPVMIEPKHFFSLVVPRRPDEEIFIHVLLENPLADFVREELSGQRLVSDAVEEEGDIGHDEPPLEGSAFDRILGKQFSIMRELVRELQDLPDREIFDRASVDKALKLMARHRAVVSWAIMEMGAEGVLSRYERKRLQEFVSSQVRFPSEKAALQRLKTFQPQDDYKVAQIEQIRSEWLAELFGLELSVEEAQ